MNDDQEWQAMCASALPPHALGPWKGAVRKTQREAENDADRHNADYPGHDAEAVAVG